MFPWDSRLLNCGSLLAWKTIKCMVQLLEAHQKDYEAKSCVQEDNPIKILNGFSPPLVFKILNGVKGMMTLGHDPNWLNLPPCERLLKKSLGSTCGGIHF